MSEFCRRTLIVSLLILTACAANAAAATFTAAASGEWTTPATWTFTGTDADGIPDADDTVSISTTRVVTVTGAQFSSNVSVPAGGTLTIGPGSSLTMSGTYTNSGTTNGTGSVTIQGTSSFTIGGSFTAPLFINGTVGAGPSTIGGPVTIMTGATLNSTNQTFTVNGNLTVDAGGTMTKTSGSVVANGPNIINNGTINGGSLSFGGGTQTYSGSGVVTATFSVPNLSTVTLGSSVTLGNGGAATSLSIVTGGTVALAGNVLTINGGSFSSSAGTMTGAGSVRMQGTSTMNAGSLVTSLVDINTGTTTAAGNTLGGPLTIDNGATFNITNQTVGVAGDLTINAGGTLDNGIATSGTLNAAGANIVNNGTIDIGSFVFARAGVQTFSGSGSLVDSMTVVAGSITTLTSGVTVGNGLVATTLAVNTGGTLDLGAFDMNLNRVTMSGTGSVTGTGSIRFQGTSSLTSGPGFTVPFVITAGTTNTASGTIGSSLTILNGATLDITNTTLNVFGDLTIDTGGTLTNGIATSGTVNASGSNIVNNGFIDIDSLVFARSGSQTFSGSGALIDSMGVLNGSVTTLASDITIGNGIAASTLVVNTGGTLAVGGFTLTCNGVAVSGAGSFTSTGAGKIRTQGTSSLSIGAAFTGSIEVNSGTTNATAGSTIGGNLTVLSGATLNSSNQTLTVLGNITVDAGGTMTKTSSSVNANGPTVINNGTITGGSLVFGRSGGQTLSGSGSTAAAASVSSGSTTTLGSDHQFGTLTVNTGGIFSTSTFTAFLSGAGTALSGAGTMTNLNVTYNGIAAQTVQTANVSYNRLGIDNAAGVTLSAAESVAQLLSLANGTFNNGAFLTLAANATIARANGTLAIAPTFLGVINIEYFGSNPIATGLEIPATNTIVDLTDNNTSTVTLSSSLTVNGNTILVPGSTLTGGGGTAITFNGASFTNNGTESVPTTTFNGGPKTIVGTGAWTGGVFQLSGASAVSLANSVTFSNGSFSVPVGTSVATGGNILTFDGTTFSNAGTVTGAVRTTGANVGLTAGASGFNASLNVNSGTTTASGVVNGPLTVDATASGLMVPATLTITGNSTVNAPLSGAGTVRVNGGTISNNATVGVAVFQFGGAAQALSGSGGFTSSASVLSGSNTTLGADKQMGSVAVNAGGTFNIANRTLFLSSSGTPLTSSGTLTLTGSTVEYNGAAAQTLAAGITTYNNLSLNNSAGVTGFAGLTVTNLLRVRAGTFTTSNTYKDVQIDAAGTLAGTNATTINVSGNWVNDGTFNANGNTVNFNGASAQSIGGAAATTFNNLIAASGGVGITLGQNISVGGLLTLTNTINTTSFTITMPAAATSAGAGDVLGNVKRTGFTGGGAALSFGNPFNSIAFAAGGTVPADVTVNLVKTIPAGFPAAIQRTYTITPSGGSGYTSTVRLHYLDTELNGNAEATLKLWSFVGFWGLRGSTAANTTNNWVEQSGVSQFSPWTLSSGIPPKITGRVTYENTTVPNVAVAGTTMTATGSPNAFTTTDAAGNYTLSMLGLGSYTVAPSRPDMSSAASNGIFSNDAALISRHVVGLATLNATQLKAALVGGQPTLTSLDAGLIAQWIVGIPNAINQTGKWKFTPANRVYASVLTDQSNQDHTAILLGDVNGDWVPGAAFADVAGRSSKDPVIASTAKLSASPGEHISVPVRLDGLKGTGVSSFQFDLEYDPEVITPVANAASVAGTQSEGLAVASNVVEPGLLKVVVFGPTPVNGDGVYADLKFNVVGKEGSSSSLKLREFRFNDGIDEVSTVEGRIKVGPATDEPALTGTLLTPTGEPVMAAAVTLTGTGGEVRKTRSDHTGQFRFDGLVIGETYTVSIASRRYKFDPISVSVVDHTTTVDIIAR